MLRNSDFTSIIALSIPLSVHENTIKDIFKCGFSPKKIDFIFSSQIIPPNKNVIVTFESNDQAKLALQFYSCSIINYTTIHFYAADKETKKFLKEKKKTIYFYITDNIVSYPHFYGKCQEYGEIEFFQFDEKNSNGSVTFRYTENAIKARYELERVKISGFHIKTSFSSLLADHSRKEKDFSFFLQQTKNSQLPQKLKEGDDSSIFMLDIHVDIDEQFLQELLIEYEIKKIKLRKRKDHEISNPSYYAIITFESREKAKEVLNDYNFTKFDNKTIRIDLADTETRKILATNQGKVLVSNLKTDIEISQMFESFSIYGEIVDIEMPTKNGENCGFCYIQYRNKKDAETAIHNFTDATINGQLIYIKMVDENDKNVPSKEFLFKKRYSININNQNIKIDIIISFTKNCTKFTK